MAFAGQAATHSWHSEHTPQSRQRPAAASACASVSGGSISAKSAGAALSTRSGASGGRTLWLRCRASTDSATVGNGSVNSRPVNDSANGDPSEKASAEGVSDGSPCGSPRRNRSIAAAATRPCPTASAIVVGPVTTSRRRTRRAARSAR
jgi:hypothetical protein